MLAIGPRPCPRAVSRKKKEKTYYIAGMQPGSHDDACFWGSRTPIGARAACCHPFRSATRRRWDKNLAAWRGARLFLGLVSVSAKSQGGRINITMSHYRALACS